jgi:hypothetical protein
MLFAVSDRADEPVRFRGLRVIDSELYFVVNYTAESEDRGQRVAERAVILQSYAWTTYWHDYDYISGEAPVAMRILEVNNTDSAPKSAYVSTSATRRWINNSLSDGEFGRIVSLATRNQTAQERARVEEIDRAWENHTYHNESYDPCC